MVANILLFYYRYYFFSYCVDFFRQGIQFRVLNIGLTGGIGCGKSTVLDFFRDQGMRCLSADAVVHRLLSENRLVIDRVVDYFGEEIRCSDSTIDRNQLAERIFQDATALEWLESLLHPLVQSEWKDFISVDCSSFACVEIPLLFEKRLEKHFDLIVCITCSDTLANLRLLNKGLRESDIRLRRRQQLPNAIKVERSDFVLSNDGTLEFLHQQLILLISKLEKKM